MTTSPSSSSTTGIAGYQRFLAARDGRPDLLRHTLSERETAFARLAAQPVTSHFRPDRQAYLRNMERKRPEAGLDRRLLWLLATAKSNQAERFAIGLAEVYGRAPTGETSPAARAQNDPAVRALNDDVLLHVHLQETYHTRILADVVALFDLPVQARPPAPLVRFFITRLVFAPPELVLPLTGASEMAGCVFFRTLRDIGCELFAGEPAVADRIRVLYDEILSDEIGHVGYIAARLGPTRRRLMRWLYASIGPRFVAQMPELRALVSDAEWKRRFADFRLDEFVEECHGLAYAAATI
jgi:hypothetical protein